MKKVILSLLLGSLFFSCEKEKKKEVNLYMWGGSKDINKFIDNKVAPEILEKENIKLKRVPVVNIRDVVNKLIIEKQAGKKDGIVDIIWINGENFKTLKEAGVLEENILSKVENSKYIKKSATKKDFGKEINGMEVPFGEAQFNFIYNTENGNIPFTNWETLKTYVKNNPSRFTYPVTTNFTGSAFVRNIAIDMLGLENIQKMDDEELKKNLEIVWNFLNEIEPYLWMEGKTYPESEGKLDLLYSTGEVDITMGYTVGKVDFKVNSKEYPESSKSFLLDNGTLFNNHYLAVPKNSKNKEEALKVINTLISTEIQIEKQKPENWGDSTVLDLSKIAEADANNFLSLNSSKRTPSIKELELKRVFELSPDKLKIIEEEWSEKVGKN